MENSESRDRAKRLEFRNRSRQELVAAIDQFLESETWGRITFEKDGESFSMCATSEIEPAT